MNAILNVLKEEDIIILLSIAFTLIILIIIISIWEKKKVKKSRNINYQNFVIESENIAEEPKIETFKEEIIDPIETLDIEFLDDHIEESEILNEQEMERTQAKIELEKLYEELSLAKNEKNEELEDTLTKFELEQEEEAIISYDELVKVSDTLYKKNELLYENEEDAPLTIEDLRSKFEVESIKKEKNELDEFIKKMDQEEVEELDIEYKKFSPIPFISPIYGFEKNNLNPCVDIELENTANLEKLDAEIRKANEFVVSLKELEKNLD